MKGLTQEYKGIDRLNVFRKPTPEERRIFDTTQQKVFSNHNILKIKTDESGNIARWKVRLVLQGCHMKEGIHYDKTFSPCTHLESVRMLVALASQKGWKLTHTDVPNAYLNGEMEKLVFTHLPLHWNKINGDSLGKDGDVVVLHKALYGAPNAGRVWNICIDKYLKSIGYAPSPNEPALYHHSNGSIIALWVDDIFITGPNNDHITETLAQLCKEFQVKTLRQVSYTLGISFKVCKDGSYFLSQTAMIESLVNSLGLTNARNTEYPLPAGYRPHKGDCPRNAAEIENMKDIPY